MDVYSLLPLLSFVVILYLGIYVYSNNPKQILNRLFFLICLFEAYNTFTEFQLRQSYTFATADLWLRIASFWPLEIPIILHFILIFTEKSKLLKNKLTYFFIYIPALILSLMFITDMVVIKPVKVYWGWSYVVEESLKLNLFGIVFLGFTLYTLYICINYYLTTTNDIKKKQAKFVFIGIFTPFIVFIITEMYFNYYQPTIPEFTSTSLIIECGLIGYAIWKYDLFKITPLSAVNEIISTMSDLLILVDSEKRISAVNHTALKLLEYEEQEILGQPVALIFEEKDKSTLYSELFFENLRLHGPMTNTETSFKSKKGRTIPISLSASFFTDNKRRPLGLIFAGRDITKSKHMKEELKKAYDELELRVQERTAELAQANEELQDEINVRKKTEKALQQTYSELTVKAAELEEANAELSQNAYAVSHDLKAPLRAMKNYSDFLREDLEGTLDSEQKKYLDGLNRAALQGSQLVEDMLVLSRIGTGRISTVSIDAGEFLRELIASLDLPTDVEVVMENDWPTIDAEPTLLRQIFQNLINNAIKFNHSPHKRIEIGFLPAGNKRCELFVRDNGIGIEPRYHEQIFRVFRRLHTDQEYDGTGIGLSITRKAASKLNGSIRVESKPGRGSTFYVSLPRKQKRKNVLNDIKC